MNSYTFTVDNKFEYVFKSKNDLKEKSMQHLLKKAHGIRNYIKCKCIKDKTLYLQVKKINDVYYLAKYPNSEEHDINCIFHSFIKDFISEDENGVTYKPIIFEETSSTKEYTKSELDFERAKRNTFYSFCHDLISTANKIAFFSANKNKTELQNYTFQNFCYSYYISLKNIKVSRYGNLLNYIKKTDGVYFEYGIINEDLVGNLEFSHFIDEDILNINLNKISLDFNTKEYTLKEKTAKINYRRLKIAKELVFKYNIAPVPYFYNAIYKDGIIVRFYITPIYFDNFNICFTNNRNESSFVEHLFIKNKPFIKPISNNEIDSIYPSKIGISSINKIPHIIYQPSFLLFENNKIIIVEVIESKYKKYLYKKENYYRSLKNRFNFFDFLFVDKHGKEI